MIPPNPFDLSGRAALVTGGGRGIGAATVAALARAGAAVSIANRTVDVAEALAADLGAEGLTVRAMPMPGLGRADCAALVAGAAAAWGRLDIVVHNAGGCPWADLDAMGEDALDAALDLNLKPCFWLMQAAAPRMRAQKWGRFLVTSSISARLAMGGGAHYSAAKAGVGAFVRGAAFEYSRDGITVNAVEPGFIAKPGRGTLSTPEMMDRLGRHIPMGHVGAAEDVAAAMLYLASPAARYVTGQSLVVDGGASLPETGFAVERRWG
jgi:3-oxoacyl-[acyl-carrier protein] reductase